MYTPMPATPWTATVQMRITTAGSYQIGGFTLYEGDGGTGYFHFGSRTWSISPGGIGYQTTAYGGGKVSVLSGGGYSSSIPNFIGKWVWNRLSMDTSGMMTGSYNMDVSSTTPPADGWINFVTFRITLGQPDRIALLHKTGDATTSTFEHRYWTLDAPPPPPAGAGGVCPQDPNPVIFNDNVYGCDGVWTDGGVVAGALTVCPLGWVACATNEAAEALGLTSTQCHTLPEEGSLYVSEESSSGGWNCNNDEPGNSGGNDLWGCGRGSQVAGINQNTNCGVFNMAIGNSHNGPWDQAATNNGHNERYVITKTSMGQGGILCCNTSP
jgi:hypothetical protein